MTEIFEWIKRMIYLAIFLTLVLQILPAGSYRKYVKFFAGLIFVITIITPLTHFFSQENWEDMVISEVFGQEDAREKELDFSYMEERMQELYMKSLEAMEEEVREK